MSDSWTTQSGPNVRDSLRERALKRTVHQVGPRRWSVEGDPKLGDSYPEYGVFLPHGSKYLSCDCQSHFGGQYRKMCSHILATILYRQANPEPVYDDDRQDETELQDPGGLGSSESESSPPTPPPTPPLPPTQPSPVAVSIGDRNPPDLGEFELDHIPDKFAEFRSHQPPAIEQVVNLFRSGIKVVMLEAPTGTGKTLISESVRRLMDRSGVYTCTTKSLQNQVLRDFPYAKVLKGRANYPTYDNPSLTADLCTKAPATLPACPKCPGWEKGASWEEQSDTWEDEALEGGGEVSLHCHWCHSPSSCPYEIAKGEAMNAKLAVLNTAYLLNEANGPARFSKQDLIILDEADMLEEELMGWIEVALTKRTRDQLYVGEPKFSTKEDSWVEWIEGKVIPAVEGELRSVRALLKSQGPIPKLLRQRKRWMNLLAKLRWMVKPIDEGEGQVNEGEGQVNLTGWVMNNSGGNIVFKPVRVGDYAQAALWSHSQKFLLMSATIVSPEQMAADLGLEDGEWAVVRVPSTFPIQRRPIVLEGVGKLNRNTKDTTYPRAAEKVVEIARRHPEERILVHTVSYELNRVVHGRLKRSVHGERVETYYKASEREEALERFLDTPGSIMLSPSFERGVDLPHDACRVVVVAKIPFPYLGDKQINARLYGTRDGKIWYAVQTVRTLCQMTGRGMRSADDWAISYILDSSFRDLYGPNRRLFPEWWAEAIVWDENDPIWKESVLWNAPSAPYSQG